MIDGLAMKSVQKHTVRGLMSESLDFLSKSFARDNIVLPLQAPFYDPNFSQFSGRTNAIHDREL